VDAPAAARPADPAEGPPLTRASPREEPGPVSAVLADLPQLLPPEPRLKDLVEALGERGLGILLTIVTIPAIVPTPGVPAGAVFGAVLIIISAAMMRGGERIELPAWLGRLRLSHGVLRILTSRGVPLLQRIERYTAERMLWLVGPAAARWIGLLVTIMATLITLPIPFGNFVPGIAVLLMGLGLALRDGRTVAAGLGMALAAIVVSIALIVASYQVILAVLG